MARMLALLLIISSTTVFANADRDIEFILNAQNPPPGIVFEVVESQEKALEWALPKIEAYAKRLHEKLPKMKIAVVSHGSEEFSLLSENATQYPTVHRRVQDFVKKDISVHVCGTHASWKDKSAKDFPEYVDVVNAGPAKIREYVNLGYVPIQIERD